MATIKTSVCAEGFSGTCVSYVAYLLNPYPCGIYACPYLMADCEPPDCAECGLNKNNEEVN